MSIGWRIWFALLIVAALYGLVMLDNAQQAADSVDESDMSAPQQMVTGIWEVRDLTTIVVYEMIVGVVAVTSIGLLIISRDEKMAIEAEQRRARRGAHLHQERPRSTPQGAPSDPTRTTGG